MKKLSLLLLLIFLVAQLSWATTYYSTNGNPANVRTNWWTNTNGTGSNPSISGFTSGCNTFIVQAGQTMKMTGDWSIGGQTLTLNGNINLSGYTITLGTASCNLGTLNGAGGFLTGSGTFTRYFSTSAIKLGNVTGLFPMGSGTNNRSVWIGGSPSHGGTVSVQHKDASGATDFAPYLDENSQVFSQRANMSWTLSTANSFACSSCSLKVQGSGIPGIVQISDLNISLSNSVAGGAYAAPGGTTTNPQVNRTGLTQTTLANTFYFASTSNSPMPIELTSFTGSISGSVVTLNWATATEVDNHGFNVERLIGKTWQNIGFVQGSGNSNSVKNYSFVDNSAKAGSYSYRLQQVDNSGTSTYSPVIEVNNGTQPTGFSIGNYPNPFNPSTTIRYALPINSFVNITIYNMLGQKMATLVNQNMEQGLHEVNFNASSFTSGAYIYRIEAGSFSATQKMLLMK
jgi:hypothetical protein